MTNVWFLLTVAAIGGVAVTLQGQFMGIMDRQLGTLESVFITYGSGGLIIGLIMLAARGGNLQALSTVPLYVTTSGLAGLIIVGTIGFATTRIGIVATFTIMLASQFLSAAVVDHFGLFSGEAHPLNWSKSVGLVLLLISVWLVVRK